MDSRGRGGRVGEPRRVLIGVQARTNSTRLPNKINLQVSGKTILERVTNACMDAAAYINRNFNRYNCTTIVAVLIPEGDPIRSKYSGQFRIIEAPKIAEDDVLSRYVIAADANMSEFVVRITADCVLMAPYLISRCIKTALFGEYDYVSNVLVRTFREGLDVEVISKKLLLWLNTNAKDKDREHVTSLLINKIPSEFRVSHVMNDVDDSYLKTSVDTLQDYQRACAEIESLNSKKSYVMARGEDMS